MDDDEFEGSSASSQNVQNVLSYLVTCLVSMGYQVNHFLMSSEEYGSCQKRERLILTIATPGLAPIKKPSATHGAPVARESGTILPGLEDHCSYTPFRKINPGDIMEDLPRVDIVQACLQFPGHRLLDNASEEIRRRYAHIPMVALSHSEKPYKTPRYCKCCPMGTIRTQNNRQSQGRGPYLHWSEHRQLTI